MTERTQIAIKLQNVSKSFGSFRAVRDVSFIVHECDVVGFVGENGAGKTTTINMPRVKILFMMVSP
jgi:ABC-type multidrug transport system ATPase subunit